MSQCIRKHHVLFWRSPETLGIQGVKAEEEERVDESRGFGADTGGRCEEVVEYGCVGGEKREI